MNSEQRSKSEQCSVVNFTVQPSEALLAESARIDPSLENVSFVTNRKLHCCQSGSVLSPQQPLRTPSRPCEWGSFARGQPGIYLQLFGTDDWWHLATGMTHVPTTTHTLRGDAAQLVACSFSLLHTNRSFSPKPVSVRREKSKESVYFQIIRNVVFVALTACMYYSVRSVRVWSSTHGERRRLAAFRTTRGASERA